MRHTHANSWPRSAWARVVAAGVMACTLSWTSHVQAAGPSPSGAPPNIIFILVDDFSMNLLSSMEHSGYPLGLKDMMQQGTTFQNYFVSNSLCCPSRSSIFTGLYPHNTGVFTN